MMKPLSVCDVKNGVHNERNACHVLKHFSSCNSKENNLITLRHLRFFKIGLKHSYEYLFSEKDKFDDSYVLNSLYKREKPSLKAVTNKTYNKQKKETIILHEQY